MVNNRLSEGVGKKIVEALKKQSEIEITPKRAEEEESFSSDDLDMFVSEDQSTQNIEIEEDDFLNNFASEETDLDTFSITDESVELGQEQAMEIEEPLQPEPAVRTSFTDYPQSAPIISDSFANELDSFEIPSNIAVLKKLITQLPTGVTRHTGAQIIKQTMEALGISMKSVLQEAQQVQDGLSSSGKECQATIQEYKKKILILEKQSQNYQRQYTALNELISLFIQTGR